MKKTCFFISPIGPPDSPMRLRSNLLLEFLVRPAVEPLGYRVIRLDRIAIGGSLSAQARMLAQHADLVIADMTGGNANVFYELGLRHAVNKPCIHLIEAGEQIPFDVADLRTIIVNGSSVATLQNAVGDLARYAASARSAACGPISPPSAEEISAFLEHALAVSDEQAKRGRKKRDSNFETVANRELEARADDSSVSGEANHDDGCTPKPSSHRTQSHPHLRFWLPAAA